MSGKVVSVTGASGFIGSWVIRSLLQHGFTVRAIVRNVNDPLKTDFLKTIASNVKASDRLVLFQGDLLQENSYKEAFQGADIVIHCAAVVAFESKDPVKDIIQPSIDGTKNVLNCVDLSSTKKLIFTSSIAAITSYDKPVDHLFTEDDWAEWSMDLSNGDYYGYAKVEAEKLVKEFAEANKASLQAISLNPTIVFGPCFTKAHTKASPVIVRQLLYGNQYDYDLHIHIVDVRDVAEAHLKACLLETKLGEYRRFIIDSAHATFSDIANILQAHYAEYDIKLQLMNPWLVWLGSFFMTPYQEVVVKKFWSIDNARSKSELELNYRPLDELVLDTAASLISDFGIKPKPKPKPKPSA